ncbi:cation-translocating P-type ATPase [Candidatus Woesebacteria bacterium]|nr:cation-translocating P-type ATPase [Candidatus Woesebacteria bacterium]
MKGLSLKHAQSLLETKGLNVIEEARQKSLLQKFIEQFSSFLIILLIIAAIISFFIGEVVDGSLILTIVILNAFFGLYQEFKADEAVKSLKAFTISTVRVIRDGEEQEIESKFLVPGDIVILDEGDKIPADAEIVECTRLEVNESALTGESVPVVKKIHNEIFLGTIIARGHAIIKVTQTGMQTKFGQIAQQLSQVEEGETPLQKKLDALTKIIGIIGITISILVFVLSALKGEAYFPSFLLAVSLAVAVVPESLPAVMTITLSIGVNRMAKRKAIVRKLSAIEALGSTTLIATDKTGTLTTNEMRTKVLYIDDKEVDPKKLKHMKNKELVHVLLLDSILCSTASLVHVHEEDNIDNKSQKVLGDPTEGALLFLADGVGYDIETIRNDWEVVDEIPFDAVTKRMTVTVKNKNEHYVFSKGALESILDITETEYIGGKEEKLSAEKKEQYLSMMKEWAAKGLRVLALSYSKNTNHPEKDHVLIGLVGIHDPPREEVAEAIIRARTAGIDVVMITGDNETTAEAIGTSIGLLKKGDAIMLGYQIDHYSDEELLELLPKTRIFARTTPFHKSKIVSLYQQLGEIVTVTGDGVNDAIALKQSDIGVAMGKTGTDVAKETADMVIIDDNFATIVNAVEEGRNIVKRLRNAITYLLSCNLSEALSLIIGLAMGLPPLFLPIQLLYINLVTDGVPALAFAFSPSERGIMREKPQQKMTILERMNYLYMLVVGVIATVIVFIAYFYLNGTSHIARMTTAFSIMAMIQSFIFIDIWIKSSQQVHFKKRFSPIFLVTVLIPIIFQFLIVRIPVIADIFHVTTVSNSKFALYFIFSFVIVGFIYIIRFGRQTYLRMIKTN